VYPALPLKELTKKINELEQINQKTAQKMITSLIKSRKLMVDKDQNIIFAEHKNAETQNQAHKTLNDLAGLWSLVTP